MFKSGDKLICVDVNSYSTSDKNILKYLKIQKIYTFNKYHKFTSKDKTPNIIVFEIPEYSYNQDRFISVKEYRKQKLEKLNEKY